LVLFVGKFSWSARYIELHKYIMINFYFGKKL
jgi:hypothetical protein